MIKESETEVSVIEVNAIEESVTEENVSETVTVPLNVMNAMSAMNVMNVMSVMNERETKKEKETRKRKEIAGTEIEVSVTENASEAAHAAKTRTKSEANLRKRTEKFVRQSKFCESKILLKKKQN